MLFKWVMWILGIILCSIGLNGCLFHHATIQDFGFIAAAFVAWLFVWNDWPFGKKGNRNAHRN